ncbi:hypothetical protein HK096_010770, partial [Nowakowskiella sp. JEL0078]
LGDQVTCCFTTSWLDETGDSQVNITAYASNAYTLGLSYSVIIGLSPTTTLYGAQPFRAPLGTVTCSEESSTSFNTTQAKLSCSSVDAIVFSATLLVVKGSENVELNVNGMTCTKSATCTLPVDTSAGSSSGIYVVGIGYVKEWIFVLVLAAIGVVAAVIVYLFFRSCHGGGDKKGHRWWKSEPLTRDDDEGGLEGRARQAMMEAPFNSRQAVQNAGISGGLVKKEVGMSKGTLIESVVANQLNIERKVSIGRAGTIKRVDSVARQSEKMPDNAVTMKRRASRHGKETK